jgi:hypothetical protein
MIILITLFEFDIIVKNISSFKYVGYDTILFVNNEIARLYVALISNLTEERLRENVFNAFNYVIIRE